MKRAHEGSPSSESEKPSPKCPFHLEISAPLPAQEESIPPPPEEELAPPPPDEEMTPVPPEEEIPPPPLEEEPAPPPAEGESAPLPPAEEAIPPPPEDGNDDDSPSTSTDPSTVEPSSSDWISPFAILDEYDFFKVDDPDNGRGISPDDPDDLDSDQMSYESSEESDVPVDEIDNMLEEGVTEKVRERKARASRGGDDSGVIEREKVVLNEKDHNHFDVLPEGWIKVTHESGMPVYLHRKTRVCTVSRPYSLGSGSVRKHNIPLNAIPCLHYMKIQEREVKRVEEKVITDLKENEENQQPGSLDSDLPKVRVETVQENIENNSVNSKDLRDYCEKRFEFKTIKIKKFNSWTSRRKFSKLERTQKQLTRSTLPEGTNLITFPLYNPNEGEEGKSGARKEWVMNPNGKSYVCILHEFVQHALRKQPDYKYKELENAATPYSATVVINEISYGQGFGTSKKQAKSEAARETLEILIPQMRDKIKQDNKGRYTANDTDLNYFDSVDINDPRVSELCAKTCEPSPFAILLTCLQRNVKMENMKIDYDVNTNKHQKNEYTMRVGEHTATVTCKNKRDGKQKASQAILQKLHPNVTSWGSLLRMYGTRSIKSLKEKKQEEKEITVLQKEASHNSPNYAILDKLKKEMRALHEKQMAIKPIGVFIPPDNTKPSTSSSSMNAVEV